MFLNSLHYFRAITILIIVMAHSYGVIWWDIDTFWEITLTNLLNGGTYLFVFISGFLFHHLFYARFNFKQFMSKKIKNVFIPFLILNLIATVYFVFYKHTGPMEDYYYTGLTGIYDEYIRPFTLYMVTGALFPYWYVPFIMVVFLLSPWFVDYIRLSTKMRIFLFIIAAVISNEIQRPHSNLFAPQSVIYFLPVYMFGILSSLHKELIYRKVQGKEPLLVIAIILLAVINTRYFGSNTNTKVADFPFPWAPDFMMTQKLLMCILLMVFLARFEDKKNRFLAFIADSSFAIYLLHPFVIHGLERFFPELRHPSLPDIPMLFLATALITLLSLGIAIIIRKIAGQYSRNIIGW